MDGVVTDVTDAQYLSLSDRMAKYSARDLVQICRWGGEGNSRRGRGQGLDLQAARSAGVQGAFLIWSRCLWS